MTIQLRSDPSPIQWLKEERIAPVLNRFGKLLERGWVSIRGRGKLGICIEELSLLLERLGDELERTSGEVESDFLRLGEALQSSNGEVTGLTQRILDTVKSIGSETDAGGLNNIDHLVRQSLLQLRDCQEQITEDLDRFADGSDQMEGLNRLCPVIGKMALVLQVVGMNIGVESARSPEAREMFGPVAEEIRGISEQILGIAENIREDVQNAKNKQQAVHKTISNSLGQMDKVSVEAEEAVQEALDNIKKLMAISLETMNQAGIHSNEISRQVGEVVAGIQFHDNMNQRIEHICQALVDVGTICCKVNNKAVTRIERNRELKNAFEILVLQAAQLRQVIAEIDHVYMQNTRAFDTIIQRVEKLTENLALLDKDHAGARTMSPMEISEKDSIFSRDRFSMLTDALTRFRELLEQGYRLHDTMSDIFKDAAEAVGRLSEYTDQVQRSNFNIHIVALNSIVKAAHMGSKGQALESLAQEVKSLSNESDEFVTEVNIILDKINSNIHMGNNPASKIKAPDADPGAIISNSINQIGELYEAFQTDSTDTVERAEALKKIMVRNRDELAFLNTLIEDLSSPLKALEEILDALRPIVDGIQETSTIQANQLADRYTMDQERIIHEKGQSDHLDMFETFPDDGQEDDIEIFGEDDRLFQSEEDMDERPEEEEGKVKDNFELF